MLGGERTVQDSQQTLGHCILIIIKALGSFGCCLEVGSHAGESSDNTRGFGTLLRVRLRDVEAEVCTHST